MGSVSMATNLKFEVFDVFNRKEHQMNPIGQAQCKVMELLMTMEQIQRLPILFDEAICGYLTVRAWRVSEEGVMWCGEDGVKGCGEDGVKGCGWKGKRLMMLVFFLFCRLRRQRCLQ